MLAKARYGNGYATYCIDIITEARERKYLIWTDRFRFRLWFSQNIDKKLVKKRLVLKFPTIYTICPASPYPHDILISLNGDKPNLNPKSNGKYIQPPSRVANKWH